MACMRWTVLIFSGLVFLALGCTKRGEEQPKGPAAQPSVNRGKIEGTRWSSEESTFKGQRLPANTMRLVFGKDGSLRFSVSDRRFVGKYSLGPGILVNFTFEQQLGEVQTHVQRVTIEGDKLTLQDSDGTNATFVRVRDEEPETPKQPAKKNPPPKGAAPAPVNPPPKDAPQTAVNPPPIKKPAEPVNGLVAHWTFDNIAADGVAPDISGRINHGNVYAHQPVAGVKGSALAFAGKAEQYFDMGNSADFHHKAGAEFSYTGFFVTKRNRGSVLVQRELSRTGSAIYIRLNAGHLSAVVRDKIGNSTLVGSRKPVNDNVWHHFAVTRKGSVMKFYLDGQVTQEEANARAVGAIVTTNHTIGGDPEGTAAANSVEIITFEGSIDEVRVYQRALADQEIAALAREFGK